MLKELFTRVQVIKNFPEATDQLKKLLSLRLPPLKLLLPRPPNQLPLLKKLPQNQESWRRLFQRDLKLLLKRQQRKLLRPQLKRTEFFWITQQCEMNHLTIKLSRFLRVINESNSSHKFVWTIAEILQNKIISKLKILLQIIWCLNISFPINYFLFPFYHAYFKICIYYWFDRVNNKSFFYLYFRFFLISWSKKIISFIPVMAELI